MRVLTAVLSVFFAFAASSADAAKLYKWVDKDGKISYQDQPPPPDAGRVMEKNLTNRAPWATDDTANKPPIVLYSVPKCSPCDLARAYLQKRNVPFTEKNVQGNAALQEELKQKVGEVSVPAILVGNKVIKNYVESWLESELDQAGYPKIESAAEGGSK